MSRRLRLTQAQHDASLFASTRGPVIDALVNEACREAIGYFQAGRRGRAEYELVRVGLKVARIVGDRESAEYLGELRLFEPCHVVPGSVVVP